MTKTTSKIEYDVEERKIWWIASYPKSGNTWVRMFVNAYVSGFPVDINSGFQYAVGDQYQGHYQACTCRPVDRLSIQEQVFIRPAALLMALNLAAAKHVCMKTHHAKVTIDGIVMMPPTLSAGSIYIVRDPRDIAISYASHLNMDLDRTIAAMGDMQHANVHKGTNLMHLLGTWSFHVNTWTKDNKDIPVTVLRYEDMLTDPVTSFTNALNGLGFKDIEKDKFDFALEQTKFKNLQKLEDDGGFRENDSSNKFFRKGTSEQWKEVLTPEQVKTICGDHEEVMTKFGYL
jgi:hypothetical protein